MTHQEQPVRNADLIYQTVPTGDSTLMMNTMEMIRMWECEYCGEENDDDAWECEYCGLSPDVNYGWVGEQ